MGVTTAHLQALYSEQGYCILDSMYPPATIASIIDAINAANQENENFRKGEGLFAIRQFLKEVPAAAEHIFSAPFKALISEMFGSGYFVVKSIYFDKPQESNWFVPYHQDLTISVNKKYELDGFGPWTVKQGQYAVQPPLAILKNNFTIRIHLDDTTTQNGALRVIPGSHLCIHRIDNHEWDIASETICPVPTGGIMIKSSLLLHASGRTTNSQQRRVVHIEFSNQQLPAPLEWSEYLDY